MGSALVVEDETEVRELVRRYLQREDLSVVATGSGAAALGALDDQPVDVVVLDLGLPDVDGEEVLVAAAERQVPVVVLTARGQLKDRIRGLELGAADYVAKPFSPRELTLRVLAVLQTANKGAPSRSSQIELGGRLLTIDQERHEATVQGRRTELTPTEWDLLVALASRPGRVFSRFELANRLRGYEFAGYERTIDSHVKNLRHKLGECAGCAEIVQTVPGVGYRMGLSRDVAS
jgi:DNA-binding response OmpR family regulator